MRWHHYLAIYAVIGVGVAVYDQWGVSPKKPGTFAFDTALWPMTAFNIVRNLGTT